MRITGAAFFLIILCTNIYCNDTTHTQVPIQFVESNFTFKRIVPVYSNFPETKLSKSFGLSVGQLHRNPNSAWAVYNNYPFTGISLSYTNHGNNDVFGSEFKVMPFIELNTRNCLKRAFLFRIGLGSSYTTGHYDAKDNPQNKALGSAFNWTFQLQLYYNLWVTKSGIWRVNAGYFHSSNGHVQLPNPGLNSGAVGLSYLHFANSPLGVNQIDLSKPSLPKSKHYFAQTRLGLGLHEFGGSMNPIGGPKGKVLSYAASGGIIFKRNLKVQAGLAYRYYQHFFIYLNENEVEGLSNEPLVNASNIYFFLGAEFLYGHIGANFEGGLNLFKPFFKIHRDIFNSNEGNVNYWLKRHFNSRLGLKLYLFNTNNMPKHNLFIGAHINANFGQADFSDISLGYIHLFKGSLTK